MKTDETLPRARRSIAAHEVNPGCPPVTTANHWGDRVNVTVGDGLKPPSTRLDRGVDPGAVQRSWADGRFDVGYCPLVATLETVSRSPSRLL